MNLDTVTLQKLMGTYGAPASAANMQRAREFFAANPDVAERRAMGMRGSIQEDNSDILGAMLDKFVEETAASGIAPNTEPPPEALPTVQNATTPNRRSATAAPKTVTDWTNATENPNLGTLPARDATPGERDAAQNAQQGSFWDDVWKALLGASSVGGRAIMGGRGGGSTPPTPVNTPPEAKFVGTMQDAANNDPRVQGYRKLNNNREEARTSRPLPGQNKRITDQTPGGNFESVGEEMQTVKNRNDAVKNARERQLREEVDAENRQANTLQEQIMRRNKEGAATADLVKKAKQAVGRK